MTDTAKTLPSDTQIVDPESIEIWASQNVSSFTLQLIRAMGLTQAELEARMDDYAEITTVLSLTVLALIEAAGGDFSKPVPPPAEFKKILDRIAVTNAYCVEYEPHETESTGR